MRTQLIFPLVLLAAAGCTNASGRDGTEQATVQAPRRDLTLQQAEAPEVRVASPVELARLSAQSARTPRSRRARPPQPVPAPAATPPESSPTPVPRATTPPPTSVASSVAADADDPYALPPGKTVTVIPASSGPSAEPRWTDRGPPDAQRGTTIIGGGSGGRGGDCGGRGPRPGRPDGFRGLR